MSKAMRIAPLIHALLLVAVASPCSGCLPGVRCSGDYYTAGHSHVSEVDVTVEGPGLESVDWILYVNFTDYSYEDDWLTIKLVQTDCEYSSIFIESRITEEGYYYVGERPDYDFDEECTPERNPVDWNPVSTGTVTFDRAHGEVTIRFDNLQIINTYPLPEDPPGLSSITLNGEYYAPVYCAKIS